MLPFLRCRRPLKQEFHPYSKGRHHFEAIGTFIVILNLNKGTNNSLGSGIRPGIVFYERGCTSKEYFFLLGLYTSFKFWANFYRKNILLSDIQKYIAFNISCFKIMAN